MVEFTDMRVPYRSPGFKWQLPRYALLAAVLGGAVWLALGYGDRTFEAFCPFGGAEALWGLIKDQEFSCSLGALNLSLFAGVTGLALLAKKAFCGWLCPIGFLGELLARAGAFFRRGFSVPAAADARLKLLRYAVLALALFFTYKTGELVLRGFDPYFLIFSGFGHGSLGWISIAVLALTALGALLIPMFFCRYLCPLGALFDPLSRVAPLRLKRDEGKCTSCGLCARACPHSLPVDKDKEMRRADCTNCQDCVGACPEPGALRLGLAGIPLRPARAALAPLAVLMLAGAYGLRGWFDLPTMETSFTAKAVASASFAVSGLKCKGTSKYLTEFFKEVPGIASVTTFASEHKAVIGYDPALITPEKIAEVLEQPVEYEDGTTDKYFSVRRLD